MEFLPSDISKDMDAWRREWGKRVLLKHTGSESWEDLELLK